MQASIPRRRMRKANSKSRDCAPGCQHIATASQCAAHIRTTGDPWHALARLPTIAKVDRRRRRYSDAGIAPKRGLHQIRDDKCNDVSRGKPEYVAPLDKHSHTRRVADLGYRNFACCMPAHSRHRRLFQGIGPAGAGDRAPLSRRTHSRAGETAPSSVKTATIGAEEILVSRSSALFGCRGVLVRAGVHLQCRRIALRLCRPAARRGEPRLKGRARQKGEALPAQKLGSL
jgi:hypothetical protein